MERPYVCGLDKNRLPVCVFQLNIFSVSSSIAECRVGRLLLFDCHCFCCCCCEMVRDEKTCLCDRSRKRIISELIFVVILTLP